MNPNKFLGFAHELEKIALEVDPAMLSSLLGAVPGAAIGYTQTRDPNARLRNMLLGGAGGALAGYGLGRAVFVDPESVSNTRDWNKLVDARNAVTDRLSKFRNAQAQGLAAGRAIGAGEQWKRSLDQAQQLTDSVRKARLDQALAYIQQNKDVVQRAAAGLPEALQRARSSAYVANALSPETAERAAELGEQLSDAGSVAADMEMPVTISGNSAIRQVAEGLRNRRWAGSASPLE